MYLPGVDGGDIWDLPNPNLYFADELFSNSTTNIHACIPEALSKMVGIKTLSIGYTRDIELAEEIARATGAKELRIETRPEGETLMLDAKEQAKWRKKGWTLEGRTAKKMLRPNAVDDVATRITEKGKKSKIESGNVKEGYSEGGRLKANMLIESGSERIKSGESDDSDEESEPESSSQNDDPHR